MYGCCQLEKGSMGMNDVDALGNCAFTDNVCSFVCSHTRARARTHTYTHTHALTERGSVAIEDMVLEFFARWSLRSDAGDRCALSIDRFCLQCTAINATYGKHSTHLKYCHFIHSKLHRIFILHHSFTL